MNKYTEKNIDEKKQELVEFGHNFVNNAREMRKVLKLSFITLVILGSMALFTIILMYLIYM